MEALIMIKCFCIPLNDFFAHLHSKLFMSHKGFAFFRLLVFFFLFNGYIFCLIN